MAFVHRETDWRELTGPLPRPNSDKASFPGANKRSNQQTNQLIQAERAALRRAAHPANSERIASGAIECPTLEIVAEHEETQAAVVVVITPDEEMRAALTDALPDDCILFADTPEQVIARPVPKNCAVLIVEQSISRPAFEHLKAHLRSAAPALVNVMVGAQNDGSSLIGLLSAGAIDRFMVKPLKPSPTRSAIRSALLQHHSLRPRGHGEEFAKPDAFARKAMGVSPESEPTPNANAHDQAKRSDRPKIVVVAPKSVERANSEAVATPFEDDSENETQPARAEPVALAAVTPRQLPPRSWNLALAAAVAVSVLIAMGLAVWARSTRAPEVNVNTVIAVHLTAAQRAFELGSYVDPPGLNATHFFNAALELDPTNAVARQGLAAVAARLVADGKQLIAAGDLLRAQSALDNVRRLQPHHPELAEVTVSLLNAREAERVTIQAARSIAKPVAAVTPQVAAALPVVGKTTASVERKVGSSPPRHERVTQERVTPERATQSAPAVIGRLVPSSPSKPPAVKPAANTVKSNAVDSSMSLNTASPPRDAQVFPQVTQEKANQETLASPSRIDDGRVVAPAREEPALRAAAMVAAVMPSAVAEDSVRGVGSTIAVSANAGTGFPAASSSVAASTNALTSGSPTSVANSKASLIKYVAPVYPYKARGEGLEGWVDVNFLITGSGSVIDPRIGNSTLGEKFHRAAVAAVTQWKFSKAPDGAAQNRPMHVRLEFKLRE